MTDDFERMILPFPKDGPSRETTHTYGERGPSGFPRCVMNVAPEATGFNVAIVFCFPHEEGAKAHMHNADDLFYGLPGCITELSLPAARTNENENFKNYPRAQHYFPNLVEEEVVFLLQRLVKNGAIAVYSHTEYDLPIVTGLRELREFLEARGCELPEDLFKRQKPTHTRKQHAQQPQNKDELWVVRFTSDDEPSGPTRIR
jgi:hypothetical protein